MADSAQYPQIMLKMARVVCPTYICHMPKCMMKKRSIISTSLFSCTHHGVGFSFLFLWGRGMLLMSTKAAKLFGYFLSSPPRFTILATGCKSKILARNEKDKEIALDL